MESWWFVVVLPVSDHARGTMSYQPSPIDKDSGPGNRRENSQRNWKFAILLALFVGALGIYLGYTAISMTLVEEDVRKMIHAQDIHHSLTEHAVPTATVVPESMHLSSCIDIGTAKPLDELARSVRHGVVRVAAADLNGDDAIGATGFIVEVDDGLIRILTAYHIVEDRFASVVCFHDDQSYRLSLESFNKSEDWAVLTVCCPDGYWPVTMGSMRSLWYGDEVLVVGYSADAMLSLNTEYGFVVKEPDCRLGQFTIAGTVVSGEGNSGGPVFSTNGEVVGMVTSGGAIDGDRFLCASPIPDWER